jgi:hypothetical protein
MPRRFELYRHRDISGVSGTGVVAEGVLFSTGWVALHWSKHPRSMATFTTIDELLVAHGHQGATVVRFIDDPEPPKADTVQRDHAGWPVFDSRSGPHAPHGPYDDRD